MAPRTESCEFEGCAKTFTFETTAEYVALLQTHMAAMHPAADQCASGKAEKPRRPELSADTSEEDWSYFVARFDQYKRTCGLVAERKIVDQLLECCSDTVRRDHHRTYSGLGQQGEEEVLKQLKKIAVRKQNIAVNRVNLGTLKQDPGEPVRKFAGRVRSLATVCEFTIRCTGAACEPVSYMEEVIIDQVMRGLANSEIQKDVLGLDRMGLEKLLLHVEGKESGHASQGLLSGAGGGSGGGTGATGGARVVNQERRRDRQQKVPQKKCTNCTNPRCKGGDRCGAREKECYTCRKKGHVSSRCPKKASAVEQSEDSDSGDAGDRVSDSAIFISGNKRNMHYPSVSIKQAASPQSLAEGKNRTCSVINGSRGGRRSTKDGFRGGATKELPPRDCTWAETLGNVMKVMVGATIATTTTRPATLHHHTFDVVSQRWKRGPGEDKRYQSVEVTVDKSAMVDSLGKYFPTGGYMRPRVALDRGLVDTGASVCLAGPKLMERLHLRVKDLARPSLRLYGANGDSIELMGAAPTIITDRKSGRQTRQLIYFSSGAELLLSYEACLDLGLVNHGVEHRAAAAALKAGKDPKCPCKCPVRETAPDPPTELPMAPTPENVPALEEWICQYYAASAFCACECQPLPSMHGAPVHIHLQEDAVPVASHSPIPIPLHWHAAVKKQLDRDEAIGVIERVPSGSPTKWCHKMVVVPKKDNTPRRTVNFVPLNRYSSRQTHHTRAPFQQASMVPPNMYKTVCDAWNGYHSVLLDEESRDLCTFITPWGRYRYRSLPQGFLAAGDAYTERYDRIITDVEDKEKIVDDTILWKPTIREAFFQACEYLTLCSRNGIVFNRKKFCFAREEVEYAGFEITMNEVKPCKKILDSIRDFPVPKTLSDIRGWFGLVNQVAPFYANRRVMEPFRELLKPPLKGKRIYWDENLTNLFEESKRVIVDAIRDGIKCFRPGEWTCLMPDFCKTGIGFLLMQKRCGCGDINPYCCQGGWQVVLAGSRFTKPAESRYAPVEGEALAVAWALEATKHYTLGNSKLLVATDHKPLLKILGDRKLEDIPNPRLLRLKEKTLAWRFDVKHVPGRIHVGPDALSRKEVSGVVVAMLGSTVEPAEDDVDMDTIIEAQIAANTLSPITWGQVRDEVARDKVSTMLCSQIVDGFPAEKKLLREELREYYQFREHLTQIDGVPLYKERVVVPTALRPMVLETLHGAHQGEKGMNLRAQSSVWWPGITPQIKNKREMCQSCNESTPTQPAPPPDPLPLPDYPFQQVASDYFQLGGHTYLVIVDRFSGWPVVTHCGGSTGSSGKLRDCLRDYFATFGIPEELATDGGLTYMSYETQKFLKDYGVKHRLSSVALPQSNKRAELAVKSMKRLLRENTNGDGSLKNDKYFRALMSYRNTPDRDTKKSPAQVIFGRALRDFLPAPHHRYKPHPEWIMLAEDREKALAKRSIANMERLSKNTKALPRLAVGDNVLVQNQVGNHPSRWDITGVVVELKDHDQYVVRVDGSGRLTLRNRRFLRKLTPYAHSMMKPVEPVAVPADPVPETLPSLPPSQRNPAEPNMVPCGGGPLLSGENDKFDHVLISNPVTPPHVPDVPVPDVPVEPVKPQVTGGSSSGGGGVDAGPAPAPAPPRRSGRSTAGQAPERMNISREMQKGQSYKSSSCVETPASSVSADTSSVSGLGWEGGITDNGTRQWRVGATAEGRRRRTNNTHTHVPPWSGVHWQLQ